MHSIASYTLFKRENIRKIIRKKRKRKEERKKIWEEGFCCYSKKKVFRVLYMGWRN